jgi:DNA polymerase V
MNLYIKRNLQINEIFKQYVAEEDLYPYSIDESILDITKTWKLFGETPEEVAKKFNVKYVGSWAYTQQSVSVKIHCKLN